MNLRIIAQVKVVDHKKVIELNKVQLLTLKKHRILV
jgi:hypothetical protein